MDIDLIRQALELTGTAGNAVKSISSAYEAVRTRVKQKEDAIPSDVRDLLVQLAETVADAKLANASLAEKLAELRLQAIKDSEFVSEKARYELYQTSKGYTVWKLRDDKANGEPSRFACPNCMNDGRISFLDGDRPVKTCQTCKQHFMFDDVPSPQRRQTIRGRADRFF